MGGFSSLEGAVVGVAVGTAGAAAIEPVLEPARQEAWKASIAKIQDLGVLARLVAQGLVTLDEVTDEAKRNGFTPNRLRQRVQLELMAAPVSELLQLWRRGEFGDPTSAAAHEFVNHGLAKAQIEPQYWGPIKTLFFARLGSDVVSLAIQRRVVTDPGYLIDPPPIAGSNVPLMPVSPLDAVAEARAEGINEERLAVETRLRGIPPAPGELMQLANRGIINEDAFNLGVVEGDTRQEWAPFLYKLRRRLLSPHEYAELQLRGYLTANQRDTGAALSGMNGDDAQLLYDVLGRSIPVHQITTGLARGGVFDGPADKIPKSYLQSLQRGNLRPEYYNLGYANRYSYPSAFVTRALLTGGAITEAEGEQIFLDVGWRPDLAKKVAQHYAVTTGPVADPYIQKAETQLWTTLHRSYVAEETDDAIATQTLTTLRVAAGAQPQVLALWQAERALVRKQLSAAQVKKAYAEAVLNPETGVAWTHDDAIAALISRGYSLNDATVFLEE